MSLKSSEIQVLDYGIVLQGKTFRIYVDEIQSTEKGNYLNLADSDLF